MDALMLRPLFLLLLIFSIPIVLAEEYGGEDEEYGGSSEKGGIFLLQNSKQVVKTEGGEVSIMRGFRQRHAPSPMHIGFISMEPDTLFIPQYLDSNLILFVRRGQMRIGWIYKDDMVEKKLQIGDVYRIPAGSSFYMENTGVGQRLQIVCAIDTSESLDQDIFQSFFIGGGRNPTSLLAGFDPKTLTVAFNVTTEELATIMSRQKGGPIVYSRRSDERARWAALLQLKHKEGKERRGLEAAENDGEIETWTLRKLLNSLIGKGRKGGKDAVEAPDSYNLYDREPDFRNNYGWSVALDQDDYTALRDSGIGVYLVNLTAGSMMAPHLNPTATEYGVVLSGVGTIQVVFPNGTAAMNAEVREGDVFWVPRYFPFCQIASRSGALEFFGFTTSARKNRPQFLVGASSILRSMSGREMATAFDVSEDRLRRIVEAQRESIILPYSKVDHEVGPPTIDRRYGFRGFD